MPRRFASLVLALALPSGCMFDLFDDEHDAPARDGADCGHDDDCSSGTCLGGMCTASSCNLDGECEGGFQCNEAPTWIEVVSLGTADGVCVPDCNTCPLENDRWTCGGTACAFDPNPRLTTGGPYEAIVGEPITLEVMIELDVGREVQSIEWSYGGMIISTETTADFVPDLAATLNVGLTVIDDGYGYAYTDVPVMACIEQGGACGYPGECCAGLECSATGACA